MSDDHIANGDALGDTDEPNENAVVENCDFRFFRLLHVCHANFHR